MKKWKPVQILLIISDEEEVADIKYALDKLDLYYELSWARNGQEGMSILKDKTVRRLVPDMVLIDYELSGGNTRELVKQIRNNNEWKEFSCFLLVPARAEITVADSDWPGLSGFISKPFSVSGPASSGSLKLVMDLINSNEYRRL